MDGRRLLKVVCLLCFFAFELVIGKPTICKGAWAIHSCGGGNGKRSELEALLGEENSSESEPLPGGYASELKSLGDGSREIEDYAVRPDDESSPLSSYPYAAERSYEKISSDKSERLDRALGALITRLLLKKQLMDN